MTELPQTLTDVIRLLRRQFTTTQVIRAALHGVTDDVKAEVVREYVQPEPEKPKKLRGYRIEDQDGVLLGEVPTIMSGTFNYVHEDGAAQHLRYIDHYPEFGPGAQHKGVVIVEVVVD